MIYVLCQTPNEHCTGTWKDAAHSLHLRAKVHRDHEQAFRCYAKYLVNVLGYTKVGGREFQRGDEPILVLTKRTRYGARCRTGGKDKGWRALSKHKQGAVIIG